MIIVLSPIVLGPPAGASIAAHLVFGEVTGVIEGVVVVVLIAVEELLVRIILPFLSLSTKQLC